MINPGTGTGSTTFLATEATETQTFAAPRVGTRTQQAARYLADDLRTLVNKAHIDLARWLEIPSGSTEYVTNPAFLADLICNDIEQLLRDRLITGVHFLLSDTRIDPSSKAYPVRYHVQYLIDIPERSLSDDALVQYGGRIQPPDTASLEARFALLIDWDRQATAEEIAEVRRPLYFFDWRPVNDRYDANSLVRYRTGGLGTEVVRFESATPRNIPRW